MQESAICASARLCLGGIFDYDAKCERLDEVRRELEQANVWDNPSRAQELGKERARLEEVVVGLKTLTDGFAEASELLELAISEQDEDTAKAVIADLDELGKHVDTLEFQRMFSGEMDSSNAFVDVQAGAGGTEAQDWAHVFALVRKQRLED